MVRAQHIWDGGSLTAAFAPALHSETPIYTDADLPDFNPSREDHRPLSSKASVNVGDSSPEMLLYREAGATQLGTNLSASLGQKVVAYFEWSGGERPDLITEALDYGKATGSIPTAALSVLPTAGNKTFKSRFSVGASYTTENNITFNLEYHVNQGGLSAADWTTGSRWGRAPRRTARGRMRSGTSAATPRISRNRTPGRARSCARTGSMPSV